jgi:hypothetical protein
MAIKFQNKKVAHIRFDGHSLDVPLDDLGLGLAAADVDIKRTVARYLEVPEARLAAYVVDRHETGNLTVRPQAVFG